MMGSWHQEKIGHGAMKRGHGIKKRGHGVKKRWHGVAQKANTETTNYFH